MGERKQRLLQRGIRGTGEDEGAGYGENSVKVGGSRGDPREVKKETTCHVPGFVEKRYTSSTSTFQVRVIIYGYRRAKTEPMKKRKECRGRTEAAAAREGGDRPRKINLKRSVRRRS